MGASTTSSSSLFSIFFAIIHKWICIPVICKQFNGLIGKSKERLIIKFPLVNEKFFFGGLKDIPTTVSSPERDNNNHGGYETVELVVHRPIWFCWRMWLDRKMGLGEGFMEGDWDCTPSSKALLTLLIRARKDNSTSTRSPPKPKTFLSQFPSFLGDSIRSIVSTLNYLQHKWRTNTLIQSQKNIREHYDLGNDMFELFLDTEITAFLLEPLPKNITKSDMKLLFDAQMRKYDALCDRLNIKSTDHVLEIGCGWGHCAIRCVKRFGCKWTGLTISEKQFALCKKRVKEAGLEDKIDIKFLDYRKETGVYDKIISIEMIEAVGHEYFPIYFSTIRDRLRPGGVAAIQAIICRDEMYEPMRRSSDFIKKHIFPGGEMPSIGMINASLPPGLTMSKEFKRFGKHYSVTLDLWNASWQERRQKIIALGYSDRFIRKWEFYFVLCSALFEYGNIDVAHFSFVKEH
uniref:Cyclopropane-fatty-acyl-phospholipid synthase n=1 Tax=Panagrolaimus davidi TaxID=227884 RepID=A0A914PJ67_9BILA